ncbi:D-alanine--D-alanine ligase [Paenibacillus validus]|uniref:D-alanine--D-alanine ligase n=1 Tax=Paenibacillus validus TaxID=44253 RepID=A0A7X3CW50_9BACL|nr:MULTISPECIES: D-alanine--D-alanine ligase [Paenibacillus]MED4601551.1 D-alanine--D-alanine ligase [Paenibacillus validus]MED4608628.1 D-alanine--D-alanine ligase [Paenibacillus validus]MUG73794.1 D-alanine--D-alanine ligase [Paenibacillus validus]
MSDKIRVGLIYGGKSGEHEVSLQTALAVIKAFDLNKYEVTPFYITKTGEWRAGTQLTGPVETVQALTFDGPSASTGAFALQPIFGSIQQAQTRTTAATDTAGQAGKPFDVIFPLLHGTFGEDGTIQGLLEMANIAYVGTGVLASSVGMDKVMMKRVFAQEGLPQCVFRHFTKTQWEKDNAFFLMEIEVSIGYPCFVKPANLGSSVGISKARTREELIEAVNLAFLYDRKVIVEEFINAREVEVAVLGNDEPQASVVGEIVSSNEFYDYKAKYIDGKSSMIIPAEIPRETSDQIRELAIRAFLSVDGSGLSRVDFFLRKEDGAVFINEINTMPGFTPYSMYPLLWRESGKPYGELLDDLIQLALQRHADKQRLQYSFDV